MDIYERVFEHTPDALLLVQADGRISRGNEQAATLFGHSREALVGMPVEALIPRRFGAGHATHRRDYHAGPHVRAMGAGPEVLGLRADGHEIPVDVALSPMDVDGERVVLCVVRDVTERRRAEQRIRDSLREKDVLLQEIHHRVKNNLAVVSSLFYLQSTRTNDPEIVAMFKASEHRVRSMALVHESLYRTGDLSSVNFAEYAVTLARELERGLRLPGRQVEIVTNVEPVSIGVDRAVPCGLILNELITNALKHAFRGVGSGLIKLGVRLVPNVGCEITVRDDGSGPGDALCNDRNTFGMRLIESLTRQVDGQFALAAANPGTIGRLRFPLEAA